MFDLGTPNFFQRICWEEIRRWSWTNILTQSASASIFSHHSAHLSLFISLFGPRRLESRMLGRICVRLLVLLGFCFALGQTGLCGDHKKTPSTTDKTFIDEALAETNKRRADHGVDPLTINQELCDISQEWANMQATTGKWEHSKAGKCGENLYRGSGGSVKASKPVKAWYEEVKDYDFAKATYQKGTGHFTALVWKGTKEMCIAMAKDASGTVYVVANYFPAGNMMGAFKSNVLPRKAGSAEGTASSPALLCLPALLLTPAALRLLRSLLSS